ncbi:ribonuclease T2 family protein [Mangrovibacter yixingensis]|uniref:ribonuclease T2 family protein n=1 Tax=Mangrovibacter yixingensis TaxID=1529639 RepID=UPI001CFACA98|nr:ribonuclease I [Mangrovibacter yixingensis]
MITRTIIGCFLAILLSVSIPGYSAPLQAQHYSDFDHYVLALSWQPGFCQSMHQSRRALPSECQNQQEQADKTQFLTIHGLWPDLPRSIARQGVDRRRWMRFGCATRPAPDMPEVKASRKCAAPDTGISPSLAEQLVKHMPGAGGTSCLERYEYAKHGVCFGFVPDDYFGTMLRLNNEIRHSAAGVFLAQHYGETVSRESVNQAISTAYGEKSVKAFRFMCHGNPAWLTEIQIAIRAESINAPLSPNSFAPGAHPGNCPKQFRLDKAGF